MNLSGPVWAFIEKHVLSRISVLACPRSTWYHRDVDALIENEAVDVLAKLPWQPEEWRGVLLTNVVEEGKWFV
jgi:hypothetical protein